MERKNSKAQWDEWPKDVTDMGTDADGKRREEDSYIDECVIVLRSFGVGNG